MYVEQDARRSKKEQMNRQKNKKRMLLKVSNGLKTRQTEAETTMWNIPCVMMSKMCTYRCQESKVMDDIGQIANRKKTNIA